MYKKVSLGFIVGMMSILCIFFACARSAPQPKETPYVIAYPISWENVYFYGSEKSVVGFSSDLIYEIAKKAGIRVHLIMAEQKAFPELLENGKVDGVITAEPSNPVNDQFYEFSHPYFAGGTVVVVATNSRFKKTEDLKNSEIAYDRADGLELALGVKTSWIFRPYESTTEAITDVIAGKVDGLVLRSINATQLSKGLYRSNIRILTPPLVTQNIRLAVRRGENHELIELFNKGVEIFVKSDEYKELLNYWGLESLAINH